MDACPHIPWSSYPRPVGIVPFCRYVCARLFGISCTDLVRRVQTGTVSCPNQSSRHAFYQRRWPVWKLYASSLSLLTTPTPYGVDHLFLLYCTVSTPPLYEHGSDMHWNVILNPALGSSLACSEPFSDFFDILLYSIVRRQCYYVKVCISYCTLTDCTP